MRHTPAREIEQQAITTLHNWGQVWCEQVGAWDAMEQSVALYPTCASCAEPLDHPNHRWSQKRIAKDRDPGRDGRRA